MKGTVTMLFLPPNEEKKIPPQVVAILHKGNVRYPVVVHYTLGYPPLYMFSDLLEVAIPIWKERLNSLTNPNPPQGKKPAPPTPFPPLRYA